MRVFVAGATGVIGRRLLPLLASKGHDVIGLARSDSAEIAVKDLGAEVARADALDSGALARVVKDAAPDAVVHLLSAIPAEINPRRIRQTFRQTNRLRTEGTRNLLYAAEQAGTQRVITQGMACIYDPHRWVPATEASAWWRNPPSQFAPVLAALRELEERTKRANGLVLRLGQLYGPGTTFASDGSFVRQVQAGTMPVVGSGLGTSSFLHVDDAAAAIAAALDSTAIGALNIVDDEPAPVRDWLPVLAELLHAPSPRHIPVALARLTAGGWGVAYMTQLRGAYNMRARHTLDWRPQYVSWRQGFAAELTRTAPR